MADAPTTVVLAVDDDPQVLETVKLALGDGGFHVETAGDGAQALQMIEQAPDDGLSALVTDIEMGHGPSGWDIARRGRERNATLAVVYISGAHGDDWAAMGVPKSLLLKKPFAPAQIVTAVAGLINDAGTPGNGEALHT
jgi:CheY-like chemotaxis protein